MEGEMEGERVGRKDTEGKSERGREREENGRRDGGRKSGRVGRKDTEGKSERGR